MQQPPLLPEEVLGRVFRLARMDGISVLVVAGLFSVVAGMAGDAFGAVTGLLVSGAGALELHGASLLREGEPRGVNWLVGSQLFLLLTIFVYCALRLWHFDVPPLPDEIRPMIERTASQLHLSTETYLQLVFRATMGIFAFVSLFYQGGMAIYYLRRRAAVERALTVDVE
jgi:hypothetical protein